MLTARRFPLFSKNGDRWKFMKIYENPYPQTWKTSSQMRVGSAKLEPQALWKNQNVCGSSLARPRCIWLDVFHYFIKKRLWLGFGASEVLFARRFPLFFRNGDHWKSMKIHKKKRGKRRAKCNSEAPNSSHRHFQKIKTSVARVWRIRGAFGSTFSRFLLNMEANMVRFASQKWWKT